jgi:hypothetical protein
VFLPIGHFSQLLWLEKPAKYFDSHAWHLIRMLSAPFANKPGEQLKHLTDPWFSAAEPGEQGTLSNAPPLQ